MPEFREYGVEVDVDVEVTIEEFVDECSEQEIKELISYLHLSGYLTDVQALGLGSSQTIMEDDFRKQLGILHMNYRRLSDDELSQIGNIAKRF